MLEKILPTVIGAILTFFLGLVSKQLSDAKEARLRHEAAYAESIAKLDETIAKVNLLSVTVEEFIMESSRYRIIRFDEEESRGITHSDDSWDQVIADVDKYENYCNHHPEFVNNKGEAARDRVKLANRKGRGKQTYV